MNKYDLCLNCMEIKGQEVVCPYCKMVEDSSLESNLHLIPGTILQGKYLIGRALGQGGFGITYLAWDLNLNLKLAIKEYLPLDLAYRTVGQEDVQVYKKSFADNFNYGLDKYLEEAQTLAKFNDNPNTVNVSDFFKANSTAYMVMNYIDGITLKEYLAMQKEPLAFEKALEIFMPVLDALKEVHKAGLLHRDVSPDNILITKRGRVVLIDFGAARQAVGDKSHTLSIIMKPGFSPEEQYHSRGRQGPWTDIYAVAASIYFAITGQAPPDSLSRLSEDNMEQPSALGSLIKSEDEAVLLKAMSIKSKDRYQSIEEVQHALQPKLMVEIKPQVAKAESIDTTTHAQHTNNHVKSSDKSSVDWYIEDNKICHVERSKSKENEANIVENSAILIETEGNNKPVENSVDSSIDWYIGDNSICHVKKSESNSNDSNVAGFKDVKQQNKEANETTNNKAAANGKGWLLIGSVLLVAIIFSVILISSSTDSDATALNLNYNTLELESGSTVRLEVVVEPAGATVGNLNWWSSDSSVARVLGSGLIIPNKEGVATITVQDKETGIKDQCRITVKYPTVTDYNFLEGLYSGTLKNGEPHGEGTWVHPDGYEYEGEWKEGLKHGQGILTYPDWGKYEGGFIEGNQHGRGSYTSADGYKFMFEFIDGYPTRTGIVVLPDGRTVEATYNKNDNTYHWYY